MSLDIPPRRRPICHRPFLPAMLLALCAAAGCATGGSLVLNDRTQADALPKPADQSSVMPERADGRPAPGEDSEKPPVQLVSMESAEEAGDVAEPADTVAPPASLESDDQNDTEVWTLQELESLALQHNPAVRQASASASQADGVHNQTGLKPNPTVGYFADEISNDSASGLHGAFVSQTFVRGDKLAWNEQVVGHEVQIRRWNEKAQRQRVLTDVRLNFIDVLAAQQRLKLTREFHEVAAQGVLISEQRVAARVAGRADILQSEMQLSLVDMTIQQTEAQLEGAWQQLTAVAGLPHLSRRSLQGDLGAVSDPEDTEQLLQQLLRNSPQMAAAQHRVSRARANLQRQQVQKIPNLTAQLGTGYDDATGDSFANIQLSLPVPAHNRNQGNVHAAWAEYCAATQNVRRLTMQIRQNLAAEVRDYKSAEAAVVQYRDVIVPKADETLNLMKQAQEGGEYDFLRVLTARRAYFDANINYVDARQRLASADARINGLLLTGGLTAPTSTPLSTGLRDQALNQQ